MFLLLHLQQGHDPSHCSYSCLYKMRISYSGPSQMRSGSKEPRRQKSSQLGCLLLSDPAHLGDPRPIYQRPHSETSTGLHKARCRSGFSRFIGRHSTLQPVRLCRIRWVRSISCCFGGWRGRRLPRVRWILPVVLCNQDPICEVRHSPSGLFLMFGFPGYKGAGGFIINSST